MANDSMPLSARNTLNPSQLAQLQLMMLHQRTMTLLMLPPPSHSQPVRICKPTTAAAALKVTVPKQPSKKGLAAQAKLQKEEVEKKNIQAMAVCEAKKTSNHWDLKKPCCCCHLSMPLLLQDLKKFLELLGPWLPSQRVVVQWMLMIMGWKIF